MKLRTEQELNEIRAKMLIARADDNELHDFLNYVSQLEKTLDEIETNDNFLASDGGWRRKIGLE